MNCCCCCWSSHHWGPPIRPSVRPVHSPARLLSSSTLKLNLNHLFFLLLLFLVLFSRLMVPSFSVVRRREGRCLSDTFSFFHFFSFSPQKPSVYLFIYFIFPHSLFQFGLSLSSSSSLSLYSNKSGSPSFSSRDSVCVRIPRRVFNRESKHGFRRVFFSRFISFRSGDAGSRCHSSSSSSCCGFSFFLLFHLRCCCSKDRARRLTRKRTRSIRVVSQTHTHLTGQQKGKTRWTGGVGKGNYLFRRKRNRKKKKKSPLHPRPDFI